MKSYYVYDAQGNARGCIRSDCKGHFSLELSGVFWKSGVPNKTGGMPGKGFKRLKDAREAAAKTLGDFTV